MTLRCLALTRMSMSLKSRGHAHLSSLYSISSALHFVLADEDLRAQTVAVAIQRPDKDLIQMG
jgi:hypothetical protein